MRLQYQQKAIGAPVAESIYAKQQLDKVVLYLVTTESFRRQKADARYAIADQLWKIWSMRCTESGKVADEGDAHLVMVDGEGRQVGGSRERDAAAIWVVGKGGPGRR